MVLAGSVRVVALAGGVSDWGVNMTMVVDRVKVAGFCSQMFTGEVNFR